jgi:putative nucleotidyltransferase with HDIG domain
MVRTGDQLELRVCEGERVRDLIGMRQPMGKGIAGVVATSGQALCVTDDADRAALPSSKARIYETASFICAPILHKGDVLGVISVGERRDRRPFTEADLEVVQRAAADVAPAIDRAVAIYAIQAQCRAALNTVARAYEAKDRYLKRHSDRVAAYACALAKAHGASVEEVELVRHAAQLHDIGKLSVSEVLLDKPGGLSESERESVHEHPVLGERMLQGIEFLKPVLPIIRHHHERVDGGGYPDRLEGTAIPRLARVLAVADAYEAMTSPRPWRKPLPPRQALDEISRAAGLQFDEELAKLFCSRVITPDN